MLTREIIFVAKLQKTPDSRQKNATFFLISLKIYTLKKKIVAKIVHFCIFVSSNV